MNAIEVRGLAKSYGDNTVLAGIDLTVPTGTVFALLGPNGAGKTTTVKILATLAKADSGEISVGGFDPRTDPSAVCRTIGLTGQFAAVDTMLTGRENLQLVAKLLHLGKDEAARRVDGLLTEFDLQDAADRPVSGYSGGMTRRLDLAMTLIGRPAIIFLDEPTTGLDPRSRRAVWDAVRGLVAAGTTVFLTTQYLEEADALADRIAVIDHGTVVAEGTAAELKRLVPGGYVRVTIADGALRSCAVDAVPHAVPDEDGIAVPGDGTVGSLRSVLSALDDAGIEADGIAVHTPTLDDVFLALTSRTAA